MYLCLHHVAILIQLIYKQNNADNHTEVRKCSQCLTKVDLLMRSQDLRTADCAKFYQRQKQLVGLVQANRRLALLSHVCSTAILWLAMDHNPCKEIRREHPQNRRRYVEDSEFWAVHKHASSPVQVAMELALQTGLRPTDVLALTRSNVTDEEDRTFKGPIARR